ncbi:mucin-like protein [Eleutherodactylus coqui]|uniref:mucin-like protein n=1 Tax=Eleutherodactylus coqui TaxID=57060 RepID=UPI0034637F35
MCCTKLTGNKIEWILQGSNSTIVKLNGAEYTLPDNVTYISKITLEKTSGDEIQAAFDGGISITVSADQGALNFITMFDITYRNRTEGLLGVFNDDKTDDLMAANGTKLEFNGVKLPNESLIFEIGMTWKTTPLDSIFIYDETTGESWNTYNNNTFVPMFYDELLLTSSSDAIDKANQTCQGNDECIFDILSTGNDALGVATLTSFNSATEQNSLMSKKYPLLSALCFFLILFQ